MKTGFNFVHNYPHRTQLALKLRENKKINLHNRLQILKFLDYLETQQVGLARRIRYVQNLTKFAGILERATIPFKADRSRLTCNFGFLVQSMSGERIDSLPHADLRYGKKGGKRAVGVYNCSFNYMEECAT